MPQAYHSGLDYEGLTEEEARRKFAESVPDPLEELYNLGSAAALSGAGVTSLIADALRSTGMYDEESVIEGVPDSRPELSEFPGTYEWGMEQVGADPYAGESMIGTFFDPASMASILPAKVMAQALREGKIGQYATTTPGRIRNRTMADEGYTVNLMTGEVPTTGIMMGTYANDSGKTGVLERARMTTKTVRDWVKKNADALSTVDNYLGTWIEKPDNTLYLDVSKRFPADDKGLRAATVFGEKTGQHGGWNLAEKELTPVGNWSEFIHSDEMAGRMDEMARIGRDYMNQQETKEWWKTYGTVIEEVYGKQNMETVMGLIASTSPNSPPVENLRVATEYMRRYLKGEPLVQPGWTNPVAGEGFAKGRQMPMEKSRAKNLRRVEEGRFEDLQAEKVNDMYRAQAGDPDASVMDRWYTRLAEDPDKGIFTGAVAGQFDSPTKARNRYRELQAVIAEAAKKAGQDANNFSADIWVGMRETAKNTGKLFGQKMKPASAKGPSYGLADIFTDLLESKARFLNMSVSELKGRLAAGDANLLSLILATPLGAWLYSRVQSESHNEDLS